MPNQPLLFIKKGELRSDDLCAVVHEGKIMEPLGPIAKENHGRDVSSFGEVWRFFRPVGVGGNLTCEEIQQVYARDYTGELNVIKIIPQGLVSNEASYRYIALFYNDNDETWDTTNFFVFPANMTAKFEDLRIEFGGYHTYSSKDRGDAERWMEESSQCCNYEASILLPKQDVESAVAARFKQIAQIIAEYRQIGNREVIFPCDTVVTSEIFEALGLKLPTEAEIEAIELPSKRCRY